MPCDYSMLCDNSMPCDNSISCDISLSPPYYRLPWKDLVKPVANLARNGFNLTAAVRKLYYFTALLYTDSNSIVSEKSKEQEQ